MQTMVADKALKRLRAGGADSPVGSLAELLVDHALQRPLDLRLDAAWLARLARDLAQGWDDARLLAFLTAELERSATRARALTGSVADHMPPGTLAALREAAGVPVALDARLLMRVVDQPEIRALIQDMLQLVLADFVKRASSPLAQNRMVSGVLNRARGMMQASVAGGLITAVGEGLSAEAERRVREHADEAVSTALSHVVAQLCDPRQAQAQGALRSGMLASAAGAGVEDWTRQVMALRPIPTLVALLRAARETVATPAFEAWLTEHLPLWLPAPRVTLGAWLEGAGLLETVSQTARRLVREELSDVVASPAFAHWLRDLVADDGEAHAPARKAPAKAKAPRRKGA